MDLRCKVGGTPSCTRDVLLLYCNAKLYCSCTAALLWWTSGAMDPRCKVGGTPSCTRDVLLLYCKVVLLLYCRFTVVDERSHRPSL
jgi:hypothetical protein